INLIKILYLLPLVLLGFYEQSAAQSPASVLVDDFEDGNIQNSLGKNWDSYSDNDNGGKSHLKQTSLEKGFVTTGGYESKGMLQVDVMLDKGTYQWSPYYGLVTTIDNKEALNPAA